MQKKLWRLILASQSPRRKEILRNAGFKHTTFSSNSSESFDENLTLDENLCAIAEAKVEAALQQLSSQKLRGSIIVGADTVVVLGRSILGKPKNRTHARQMLRAQ